MNLFHDEAELEGEVRELLERLGVSEIYAGYHYTAYAVKLCREGPYRLETAQCLYILVARRYGTTYGGVRRGIRAAAWFAWRTDRRLLEDLAGRPLPERPSALEFIEILTGYFGRSGPEEGGSRPPTTPPTRRGD